jgi:hypothetical protein
MLMIMLIDNNNSINLVGPAMRANCSSYKEYVLL